MSDKTKIRNSGSELLDWMLAIDFDPVECICSRKNSDMVADILFLRVGETLASFF